jgi:hypothetical protein
VVVSPSDKKRSVEISRDSVAGRDSSKAAALINDRSDTAATPARLCLTVFHSTRYKFLGHVNSRGGGYFIRFRHHGYSLHENVSL